MTAALATHQQQQQPTARTYESEMNHPQPAKNVFVYLNGDRHFAGRKFVVNRRYISNFEGFLNEVTRGMKAPFGAIRNIYTPSAGHRIDELDKIENNMDLVAGGLERFRKLSYKEIQEASKRRRHQPKAELIYRHRNNKMTNVSARWMKYVKEPCQIYVYANGDILAPAVKLLLIPRTMKDWDLVLQEVTEKVPMRSGGAVRKVYDLNYRPIRDPTELENGAYYIACGNERLKKCPYGELPAKGHHQISPRRAKSLPPTKTGWNAPLPPIKTAFKSKSKEDGDSYTKMYAHRKQLKDETTTVMGASAATGYRAIKIKKDRPPAAATAAGGSQPASESVFHAKPVKVKPRSRPAPPSTSEEDDLFHSHAPQLAADEVEDSEDTKIDRPIDQIPVEEVHEEEIHAAADTGGGGDDEEGKKPPLWTVMHASPAPHVLVTDVRRKEQDSSQSKPQNSTVTCEVVNQHCQLREGGSSSASGKMSRSASFLSGIRSFMGLKPSSGGSPCMRSPSPPVVEAPASSRCSARSRKSSRDVVFAATAPAPATGPADDSRPATPEEKIEEVTVVAESEPTAATAAKESADSDEADDSERVKLRVRINGLANDNVTKTPVASRMATTAKKNVGRRKNLGKG